MELFLFVAESWPLIPFCKKAAWVKEKTALSLHLLCMWERGTVSDTEQREWEGMGKQNNVYKYKENTDDCWEHYTEIP